MYEPNLRESQEAFQNAGLRPWGIKASESLGRRIHEDGDPDEFRTAFQRDRDRILYSTAFKRLAYKTQVYVVHEGDFYRTRLTHTLEVMQHARTLARILGANEDLVEAIAYAHDLGHSPFGHAGETELNLLMVEHGFDHNLQSLRIVDSLEKRYRKFDGLNLTFETREGLARHATAYDNPCVPAEFKRWPQPSLEAQIVNVADELAFCAHDLDDALQAGLLSLPVLLDNPLVNQAIKDVRVVRVPRGKSQPGVLQEERVLLNRTVVRNLINILNMDVIKETTRRLADGAISSVEEVRQHQEPLVALSPQAGTALTALKRQLFEQVYEHWAVLTMVEKGRRVIRELFAAYVGRSELLPPAVRRHHDAAETEQARRQVICDYIAGMTDRRAGELYSALFDPSERAFTVARTPF